MGKNVAEDIYSFTTQTEIEDMNSARGPGHPLPTGLMNRTFATVSSLKNKIHRSLSEKQ